METENTATAAAPPARSVRHEAQAAAGHIAGRPTRPDNRSAWRSLFDLAPVAQLLHDIGRLVLATQFSRQYAAVTAQRADSDSYLLDAERAVLALDHAVVGAALAQHWKFPELMQQVLAQHHDIGSPGVPELALVVHLADAVAHALDFSMADDDLVPLVADATWLRLGLDEQKLRQTFRDAERQFDAACGMLAD